MAIPIETLVVQLRADVKGLQSGLARATKTTQASSAKMSKAAGTVGLAFKSMLAPLIGIAGVTLAIRKLKGLADSMDRLAKLSVKIGVDVGALSELEFVAERSGIAFRSMAMALQRASVSIAEAAEGTGEAKQAIEDLGISAKDLVKIPIDRQLEVIADAFLKVENDSKRSQLAVDIFGARGAALLQAMRTGGKGIRELREEARKAGLTLSKEAAENAEKFADSVSNLGAAFKGFGIVLEEKALPGLIKFVDKLTEGATSVTQLAKDIKTIREVQKKNSEETEKATGFWGKYFERLKESPKIFLGLISGVTAGKEAVKGFSQIVGAATEKVNEEAEAIRALDKTTKDLGKDTDGDKTGEDSFFKKFTDGFKDIKQEGKLTFGSITKDVEINTQAWSDAFGDQLLSGKKSFQDFRDFAISAINDIVREMFKAQVIAPFVQGITRGLGNLIPGGGFFSGLKGGALSTVSGGAATTVSGGVATTVTAAADGAEVSRGQTTIVGDGGEPEIFVPKVSGTIIPFSKLGGGGGVNITQNFNISPGLEETVQAKIEEAAPFIAQSAKTAVFQAIEKGGGASRSVGRRA